MGFASRSFGGHTLFDARARERALRSRGPLTNCAATERVQCRTAAAADPLFTLSDFNSCKHRIYKQPVRPNSEESDPPTNVVFMERLMYASAFPTGARVTRKSRNAARNVSPSAAVLKACRLTHFLPFNYHLSRFSTNSPCRFHVCFRH